jgi:hypothetical protein
MIRWTPRNKAIVLYAIEEGHLSQDLAREHYGISITELMGWKVNLEDKGIRGLLNNPKSSAKGWHREGVA